MTSIPELLTSAVQLHRGGQTEAAQKLYEQALSQDPRHPDALNLLGLLLCQTGQHVRAVELLRQAIANNSTQASYFANLGEAHRGLGQRIEAIECYQEAVRLAPQAFEFHNNLATLLQNAGRVDEAIASYQRALAIQPQYAEGHFNLGSALQRQGKLHEAATCYQRAIQLQPNHVRALNNLGGICNLEGSLSDAETYYRRALAIEPTSSGLYFNLGNVNQALGRPERAIECFRQAVKCDPENIDALSNLGSMLQRQRQLDESLDCLERAVRLRPQLAIAHCNLGVTYQDLARLEEAQRAFERAVELEPKHVEFIYNLGTVLRDRGDVAGAIARFDEALRIEPSHGQALCARGTALLSRGDFLSGWADYEHRVRCPQYDTLTFPQPLWDGSPLADRVLLIHCEQGLGDTIQFIRYANMVAEQGGQPIIAIQPALLPLLEQSSFANLVSKAGTLPPFDVHVPLMSLPHIFRTEIDTVPNDVPYLSADPMRVARWRDELAKYPGVKVGIAWQGRPDYRADRLRSFPLTTFAPLAKVPGVRLFSLQKGTGSEQVAALDGAFEVIDLASSLDKEGGAFMDTAAAMQHLDVVIAPDTALVHLAGALGVRVWLPMSHTPDWRWMFDRHDSPWYPTMQIFRQTTLGNWSDVIERMAKELLKLTEAT